MPDLSAFNRPVAAEAAKPARWCSRSSDPRDCADGRYYEGDPTTYHGFPDGVGRVQLVIVSLMAFEKVKLYKPGTLSS